MTCNKNGIKREGESCTLNNNCIYPECMKELTFEDIEKLKPTFQFEGMTKLINGSKD